MRASVAAALYGLGRSDLIESRLSGGTATDSADLHDVPLEPTVQERAVSAPLTSSVKVNRNLCSRGRSCDPG
jgi:hypothetical protein